jgi:F-type H+-transporting ATPase subunit epsilon
MLAGLQPGELWFRNGAEKQYLSIQFGLAEVLPDKVTVLATIAERPDEIDVNEVEAAKKAAEQEMRHSISLEDAEKARLLVMASIVRLRVAERARGRRG